MDDMRFPENSISYGSSKGHRDTGENLCNRVTVEQVSFEKKVGNRLHVIHRRARRAWKFIVAAWASTAGFTAIGNS